MSQAARRTVVFDVGGVIVRWQPNELMQACFPAQAPDEASAEALKAEVFQAFDPQADWSRFDLGTIEPPALADRIAARTGLPRAGVVALIDAIPQHLQPMPDSVALLHDLRARGHRLVLLSNMPRPYAAHLEAAHECFSWFAHRSWSGRIGHMKPLRPIFDHTRDAAALDLDHTVFIDDHHGNVEAARGFGWRALHFSGTARCRAELQALGY